MSDKPGPLTAPAMWSELTDRDGGVSLVVPEFGDAMRRRAADELAVSRIGFPLTDAEYERVRSHLFTARMRQHMTDPDSCYCEDVGWWCTDADGPVEILTYSMESTSVLYEIDDDRADRVGIAEEPAS